MASLLRRLGGATGARLGPLATLALRVPLAPPSPLPLPLPAVLLGVPGGGPATAVRAMKVRSSLRLLCDHCRFGPCARPRPHPPLPCV
jgi:hypothetical protein